MRLLPGLLVTLALSSCGERLPETGALKVVVRFSALRPACVDVSAQDAQSADRRESIQIKAGPGMMELVVAVFPGEDWGPTVEVAASGREGSCLGPVVVEQRSEPTRLVPREVVSVELLLDAPDVDGDGYAPTSARGSDCDDGRNDVNPGRSEACNGRDDDCDGQVDEGCRCVGAETRPCYEGASETLDVGLCQSGTQACVAGDFGECLGQTLPTSELCGNGEDDDCDGVVDNGCGCAAGTAQNCYGGPGGTSGVGVCRGGQQSCEDGGWGACLGQVLPSKELCDGLDNDCNAAPDDGLSLGTACTSDGGCTGALACASDGGVTCMTPPPPLWYPDADGDGQGDAIAPVAACTAPSPTHLASGLDCDDGDPFSFDGAPELCDGRDNDCDGVLNDTGAGGVCPGAQWAARSDTSSNSQGWRAVTSSEKGAAFVVGDDGWVAVRHPSTLGTADFVVGVFCGIHDWRAAAATPGASQVFLGGANGELASATVGGPSCPRSMTDAPGPVTGLVAVQGGAVFGVTSGGATFRFEAPDTVVALPAVPNAILHDVHGLSGTDLLAVGRKSSAAPLIVHYDGAGWTEQPLPASLPDVALRSVHQFSPDFAVAVGNDGLVLQRRGGAWSLVPPPPGNPNLRGVVAFGGSAIYTVDDGTVRRFADGTWSTLSSGHGGSGLRDLAGRSPDDLWAAGLQGLVLHWHEP